MKIALICKNINSPSYIFYKDSLKKIEKKKKNLQNFSLKSFLKKP